MTGCLQLKYDDDVSFVCVCVLLLMLFRSKNGYKSQNDIICEFELVLNHNDSPLINGYFRTFNETIKIKPYDEPRSILLKY